LVARLLWEQDAVSSNLAIPILSITFTPPAETGTVSN
jgi:hypothetical protein